MTARLFDVAGAVAVVAFVGALWLDRDVLLAPVRELDVVPTAAELDAGFREGVAWYGVIAGSDRVGWLRVEQRRTGHDDREVRVQGRGTLDILGNDTDIVVDMTSRASSSFELRETTLSLDAGVLRLEVEGRTSPDRLDLDVTIAGVTRHSSLPLQQPLVLDAGMPRRILRTRPEVGEVFAIPTFDPFGLSPRRAEVEYLGLDVVGAVDGQVVAHHLRQRLEGRSLDLWVNDLGEVLRQELPGGLLMVRETEAEATNPTERTPLPVDDPPAAAMEAP
jgi:hypothetical protein